MIVSIHIQDKKDKDTPIFQDGYLKGEATLTDFCVLEGGMASGKASVSFIIELPDGSRYIAQCTNEIMKGMSGALLGAEQRWEKEKISQQ